MLKKLIRVLSIATLLGAVLMWGVEPAAHAKGKKKSFKAKLSGFNEVPAQSTPGTGNFKAKMSGDGTSLEYELTVSGTTGTVLQAHIHLGRTATNGGVMVFLCGGSAPACVTDGTVTGTVSASDVISPAGQGLAAGDFDAFIDALRAKAGYVNVHTTMVGSGEIRGQVK